MFENYQFVKLAIGCLMLAMCLHLPGIIYAQEKNDLRLELFDFPVAPNQMMSNDINHIRESGALPPVGILPMPGSQTLTHVIVPYMLYNIDSEANVMIRVDPGNGVFVDHEDLIKTESDNNKIQYTSIRYTSIVSNNMRILINACQEGIMNCTSVVIIVTVDGRPPKALENPYNN